MLENMESYSREVEPPIKFYHSPLEIQQNSLATFMDEFRGLKDLKHQTSNTKDLQAELDQKKAEIEALKDQLRSEKQQQQAVEKNNSELRLERNPWKERAQLQAEKDKNSHLMASLKDSEKDKSSLLAQLEKCKATHLAQAEEHEKMREEVKTLKLELRSAKQQQQAVEKNNSELRLENNPWKKRAQLQAEKDKNSHLMASLEEAKQHLAQLEMEAEEHAKMREEVKALKLELQSAKQLQAVPKNNMDFELERYLEIEKAETQKLHHEFRQMEETLQKQKEMQDFHQAKLEEQRAETYRFAAALKQTQDLLGTEHNRYEKEKYIILQHTQNYVNSCVAQLNGKVDENRKLMAEVETLKLEPQSAKQLQAAAKNNVELESYLEIEKAETQKLHHEFRQMEETLQKQKEMQDFHQAQIEEQKAETTGFAADLKKTQDLLETERHRFEQEKESIWKETQNPSTSCLAQLNGQVDENRKLMAEVETLKLELRSAKQRQVGVAIGERSVE
ncbi:golgin subfamily B member 1-like [Centropristis striata]|uniref:golgin subfamily B member 1-like n=1 Tax=Centropristis striata TaxID=184440 RepID=UPI0027E08D6F|nr:golgin subfamily B member 1-like [Centropristis striata]